MSGSDNPIIIRGPVGSGPEDPIIVKSGGPGGGISVNILLSSPANMGWTITQTGDVTTIIIPKSANWLVETDDASGKVYLSRPRNLITRMEVDDMVDAADMKTEVPPEQKPLAGNDPEIEIYFAPL